METGAQVSLVRKGMFSNEFLNPRRGPVGLKLTNAEFLGGGAHETSIGIEPWEHDRLNRPDLAERTVFLGHFYAADVFDWDIIVGYGFMVSNAIGALPHRAALV